MKLFSKFICLIKYFSTAPFSTPETRKVWVCETLIKIIVIKESERHNSWKTKQYRKANGTFITLFRFQKREQIFESNVCVGGTLLFLAPECFRMLNNAWVLWLFFPQCTQLPIVLKGDEKKGMRVEIWGITSVAERRLINKRDILSVPGSSLVKTGIRH